MRGALPAIGITGLIVGTLDICSAFIHAATRGASPTRVLQFVASGLLGRRSFEGGLTTAALGLGLHFVIAFGATAVFLPRQSQASRSPRASDHLRAHLWHRRLAFHESDRGATLRRDSASFAHLGSDPARYPHVRHRPNHFPPGAPILWRAAKLSYTAQLNDQSSRLFRQNGARDRQFARHRRSHDPGLRRSAARIAS